MIKYHRTRQGDALQHERLHINIALFPALGRSAEAVPSPSMLECSIMTSSFYVQPLLACLPILDFFLP